MKHWFVIYIHLHSDLDSAKKRNEKIIYSNGCPNNLKQTPANAPLRMSIIELSALFYLIFLLFIYVIFYDSFIIIFWG